METPRVWFLENVGTNPSFPVLATTCTIIFIYPNSHENLLRSKEQARLFAYSCCGNHLWPWKTRRIACACISRYNKQRMSRTTLHAITSSPRITYFTFLTWFCIQTRELEISDCPKVNWNSSLCYGALLSETNMTPNDLRRLVCGPQAIVPSNEEWNITAHVGQQIYGATLTPVCVQFE